MASRALGRPPLRKSAIKITEQNKTYLKFQLIGADTSYANALRRVMVSEVATLAMSEVTIIENTSPLFDEFLAHRMGLIPLHCQALDTMVEHYRCDCSKTASAAKITGCSRCNRTFSLDVYNDTESPINVTTESLYSDNSDTYPVHSTTFSPDAFHKPITIAKLASGQHLKLTCKARKSIGKEHAKHIPGHVIMYPLPKVILNQSILTTKLDSQARKDLAAVCPTNTIVYKHDADAIEVENALSCVQCMECTKTAEIAGALDGIIIEEDDSVFYYTIETFGQFSPLEILTKGLTNLQAKVSQITGEIVTVQRNSTSENRFFG